MFSLLVAAAHCESGLMHLLGAGFKTGVYAVY